MGESLDVWVYGCMSVWVCGREGVRVCECVVVCGCVGVGVWLGGQWGYMGWL